MIYDFSDLELLGGLKLSTNCVPSMGTKAKSLSEKTGSISFDSCNEGRNTKKGGLSFLDNPFFIGK
jgi:hypothetical protein